MFRLTLSQQLAPDVVGDGKALGFMLRGVDRGADAKFLDPLWKRVRFHRIKN